MENWTITAETRAVHSTSKYFRRTKRGLCITASMYKPTQPLKQVQLQITAGPHESNRHAKTREGEEYLEPAFKSTRTPEKRRTKERKREKRKLRRTILKQPPFPSAFWRLEERERGREMVTDERQAREDGYAYTEEKEQR